MRVGNAMPTYLSINTVVGNVNTKLISDTIKR